MAHFAKLGFGNLVEEVISLNNNVLLENGVEIEQKGIDFLFAITRHPNWKKTSYNTVAGEHLLGGTPFRKNYAGIGYTYDETRDAFIPPKPYNSWILDENKCVWKAPKPFPIDYSTVFVPNQQITEEEKVIAERIYKWDENLQEWTYI